MINDHWDDGWLESNIGTTVDPIINAKMKSYWTQIATTFAGYDNHLLFAAANEPNVNNTAEDGHVDVLLPDVRQCGSRRWRQQHQSLAGAARRADPTWLNALPTDTVSNRLMVEYHHYTPSLFTHHSQRSIVGHMRFTSGGRLTIIPEIQLATATGVKNTT